MPDALKAGFYPYKLLFLYLGIVFLLFSLCRVVFYLINYAYFPEITPGGFALILAGGLRFDLTAILYTNVLFILLMIIPSPWRGHPAYRTSLKVIFLVVNAASLAANVADIIYYRFTLRRTTADFFSQFGNETNLFGLFFRFLYDYWYGVLFWMLLVWVMMKLYNRVPADTQRIDKPLPYYLVSTLLIPAAAYLFVSGGRGGFLHSTRPITLSNAGAYVNRPEETNIVLNTPFAVLRTIGKTDIRRVTYFPEGEEETIFTPVHRGNVEEPFRPDNVVVIILESFSKEFFGVFNREKYDSTYRGHTPFLDSLVQHSLSFEYSFANGRKSIDGLPSVLSSIPSLGVPYVLTPFGNNRINSLGSLLREKGYHTSFFHGAPDGSMGFEAFTRLAGFDYYGKTAYNNDADFDGIWGIWDHKFLDFYADKLNEFQQPFMSAFFSVSSHHPFKVPEEFEDRFEEGPLVIHKCVEYTDYALRKFFEKVSTMPWYEHTLFVITADHVSSEIEFEETRTPWGFYSVPIIFFKPGSSLTGIRPELAQQIDIMPTVLGYLNYDKDYLAFGRDLLNENETPYVINYNSAYQYFEGDYMLVFDGEQTAGLYNYKTDKLARTNLKDALPEVVTKLETRTRAFIQQYNNRLIDNRLTAE